MRDDVEVELEDYFFGDDALQKEAIDKLSTSLRTKKGGVYLICGGQRSGKSSVVEEVWLGFERDKSFVKHNSPATYFEADTLSELKKPLGEIDRHRILYEANSREPHEILFVHEFIGLDKIRKLLDAHKKLSSEDAPISIVIDMPVSEQPLFPGVQTIAHKQAYDDFKLRLDSLQREYPELQLLRTGYNKGQIKEDLWNLGNDYPVKAVRKCLAITFNVDVKHPAIVDVCKALKEKNREKYDVAFERIPSVEVQV